MSKSSLRKTSARTSENIRIDVSILSAAWTAREKTIAAFCKRIAIHTLNFVRPQLSPQHFVNTAQDGLEISIVLSTDSKVRVLNRDYRGKNKPTNVLSFPAVDEEMMMQGSLMLGDIVLALQTTQKEARAENKPFKAHVAHLVVHGVLHLLGYDHEIERDALKMERMERLILAALGIADPYADTVVVAKAAVKKSRGKKKAAVKKKR